MTTDVEVTVSRELMDALIAWHVHTLDRPAVAAVTADRELMRVESEQRLHELVEAVLS